MLPRRFASRKYKYNIDLKMVLVVRLVLCSAHRHALTCGQNTVIVQFTAQGANLLLVAQGRALIGEGALIRDIRDGVLILEEILRLKELCSPMDITVETLRRPDFL